jgi:hypothetical protein
MRLRRTEERTTMATTYGETTENIQWLTPDEGREFFDRQARRLLGISGEDFLRGWDAGEYDAIADDPDHPEVMRLAMLIPFGR